MKAAFLISIKNRSYQKEYAAIFLFLVLKQFSTMNIKAKNKSTILSENLTEFFGSKMNQYRIKFFGLIISALCKVQTVNFEKLVCSYNSEAKIKSSLRRIQWLPLKPERTELSPRAITTKCRMKTSKHLEMR